MVGEAGRDIFLGGGGCLEAGFAWAGLGLSRVVCEVPRDSMGRPHKEEVPSTSSTSLPRCLAASLPCCLPRPAPRPDPAAWGPTLPAPTKLVLSSGQVAVTRAAVGRGRVGHVPRTNTDDMFFFECFSAVSRCMRGSWQRAADSWQLGIPAGWTSGGSVFGLPSHFSSAVHGIVHGQLAIRTCHVSRHLLPAILPCICVPPLSMQDPAHDPKNEPTALLLCFSLTSSQSPSSPVWHPCRAAQLH